MNEILLKKLEQIRTDIASCNTKLEKNRFDNMDVDFYELLERYNAVLNLHRKSELQLSNLVHYKDYLALKGSSVNKAEYTKKINYFWAVNGIVAEEVQKTRKEVAELKKVFWVAKGKYLLSKKQYDLAFEAWGKIMSDIPDQSILGDVSSLFGDDCIHNEKLQAFIDQYKCSCIGAFPIDKYISGLTYLSYGDNCIYFFQRRGEKGREEYVGKISVLDLNTGEFSTLKESVPLRISAPAIKYISKLSMLLYVNSTRKTSLNGYNLKTKSIIEFLLPPHIEPINISQISYNPATKKVYGLDTFRHSILEWDEGGGFRNEFFFPGNMQFPSSMLIEGNNRAVIGFVQKLLSRAVYNKPYEPAEEFLGVIDFDTGEFEVLDFDYKRPIIKLHNNNEKYYLELKNNELVKLGDYRNKIFGVSTQLEAEKIIVNAQMRKLIYEHNKNQGILFFEDTIKEQRILVFKI